MCEISFLGHSRFFWQIGSDFQPKNRDRDREWESGVRKKVTPDSDSRSRKIGIGSRFGSCFGSRFGSDFFKIGSGFLWFQEPFWEPLWAILKLLWGHLWSHFGSHFWVIDGWMRNDIKDWWILMCMRHSPVNKWMFYLQNRPFSRPQKKKIKS